MVPGSAKGVLHQSPLREQRRGRPLWGTEGPLGLPQDGVLCQSWSTRKEMMQAGKTSKGRKAEGWAAHHAPGLPTPLFRLKVFGGGGATTRTRKERLTEGAA